MKTSKWLGFSLNGAQNRTILHIYPCSEQMKAPVPVELSISIFSSRISKSTIKLDGSRVGCPDGILLEDLFPELTRQNSSLLGVEIEMSASKSKIDLSESNLTIEIRTSKEVIQYTPKLINDKSYPEGVLCVQDQSINTSLLIVNASSDYHYPDLFDCISDTDVVQLEEIVEESKGLSEEKKTSMPGEIKVNKKAEMKSAVSANSLYEYKFNDSFYDVNDFQTIALEDIKTDFIHTRPYSGDVAYFTLYRNRQNQQPLSVRTL